MNMDERKKIMRKKYMPTLIICLLILITGLIGLGVHVIMKYTPTKAHMNLNEYYGQVADGEVALILGTEVLEQRGLVSGEEAYLPLEVVNTYLNQRYYWDSENSAILYATPSELLSFPASQEAGGQVWLKDGTVYLSLSFIRQYTDIDTYVSQNPARVAIQYDFSAVPTVTVLKNTSVRYLGGIKAEILREVKVGEKLIYMEGMEEWSQVATQDGYIGYIENKKISAPEELTSERDFQTEQYTYLSMDEPVNMVWHQVTSMEANGYLADAIQNMTGVNVISPTWFSIQDNAGNITSIASSDYVAQAHERGLQVWGLVDNFSENVQTTQVLSLTSSRQNLIRQLIQASVEVGLDGINVDFEYLSEEVGIHFLEFLREISIECHKNGLVLSVDNPVPEDFTSHYDRAEQGRVVDYVIIMGYDEHYVGSEEAGSVASLPWVEKGIQDTLEEVPAERVINGIPFYTRLWKTSGSLLSSEAIGMDAAQEAVNTNQAQVYWNKDVGQNYGTYELDGDTYQIWLEDAESVAAKVKLVPQYGLAGVAAWKLGFENSSIWPVITDNLQ